MAVRSNFPADLIKLYSEEGVWRNNIRERRGAYVAYDQYHETAYNLHLKSAINANRGNAEIFESIGFWLPLRTKFLEELKHFVFNDLTGKIDDERSINAQETRRHNEKVDLALKFFQERLDINPVHLDTDGYKEELSSLAGEQLIGNKSLLLNNRAIGTTEMMKFVEERLISHEKSPFDKIKKLNIPVFNYLDHQTKKKKTKTVSERTELKATAKLLKILEDRPFISAGDLGRYQISAHHALTDPSHKDIKPNIKASKAKSLSNYIVKVCPDSVSRIQPTFAKASTMTILEGENIIALGPGSDTTLGEHIDCLFRYYIVPHFSTSKLVCLMFDDAQGKHLKMTMDKRYSNDTKSCLNLTMNSVVSKEWGTIFMNPLNKHQFKKLFITRVKETLRQEFELGHILYLNGASDDGKVFIVTQNEVLEDTSISLPIGESDVKIFKFIESFVNQNITNFLVASLDTDVKILAIVFQAKYRRIQIVVKSFNQLLPFFYPKTYIRYIEDNFLSDSPLVHAENLLRVYIMFGCDQCPGFFGICHSSGLLVFDAKSRHKALSTENDFLELIIETYQSKNNGVKRYMLDGQSNQSTEENHATTREIVKCFKGVEANTIPILSVLHLHLQRSLFLQKSWLYPMQVQDLDPCLYGFRREKDGSFSVNLQDHSDPYFTLPKSLLKGCSCKTNCANKKCSCLKDEQRKKCSKVTCRCTCWKPMQADESIEEDMEVENFEDDWNLDYEMIDTEDEEEEGDNNSSEEFFSDDEYIPFDCEEIDDEDD